MKVMIGAVTALIALWAAVPQVNAQLTLDNCVVYDFEQAFVSYSFDETSIGDFANRRQPVVKVVDGGQNVSPLYRIGAAGSGEMNEEQTCVDSLNVCDAHIGLLEQPYVREHLFSDSNEDISGSLMMAVDEDSTNFIECKVVGRYLYNADGYTKRSGADSDEDYNYGGIDAGVLGDSARLSKVDVYQPTGGASTDNIQGIVVTMSNGQTQTFGDVNSGSIGATFTADGTPHQVTKVTVRYTGNYTAGTRTATGAVCGLAIFNSAGTTLLDRGCTTNPVEFNINPQYDFVGFMGFHNTNQIGVLDPLTYARMQPMVYYYARDHESVTLYVNQFWDAQSGITVLDYQTTEVIGIDESSSTATEDTSLHTKSINQAGQLLISETVACGCIPVTFEFSASWTDEANGFVYIPGTTDNYKAWSDGYYETDVRSTGVSGAGTTITSGSKYSTQGSTTATECEEAYPRMFLANAVGGALFLDGLLASSVSDADLDSYGAINDSNILDTPNAVNQVRAYYSNSNDLQGLEFSWSGSNVYILGTTSGTPTTLTSSDSNSRIAYITVTEVPSAFDFAGGDRLEVHFARPTAPCLIEKAYREDVSGKWKTLTSSGSPLTREEDRDADMYQFWLWIPVDYSRLRAQLDGYFLTADNTYSLTLMPEGGAAAFSRAQVTHAYFYHLQAEHTYDVKFWGNVDDMTSVLAADVQSPDTTGDRFADEEEFFTTEHGVRLECEMEGDVHEQVEWEALPDVEIKCYDGGAWSSLSQTPTSDENSGSKAAHAAFFPNDEYFHYDENPHCYPKYKEFVGYPDHVYVYYDSNRNGGAIGNPTDSCIRGLGLQYQGPGGTTKVMWVAGNQADYDAAVANAGGNELTAEDVGISLSPAVLEIKGSTATQDGVSCLASISFHNNLVGSACIGPDGSANECNTVIDTADTSVNDYYFSGFDVSTDGNGEFIRGIIANYAYVDIPDVEATSSCALIKQVDYNYIRNTYYYKNIDLDSDAGTCGVTQYIYADHRADTTDVVDQYDPDNLAPSNEEEHWITYHHPLIRTRDRTANVISDAQGTLSVIRQNDWQVNLFCYYNASGQVHSNFSVQGEDPQTVAGTNEFKFQLKLYKDNYYQDEYTGGEVPIMLLGESVHMAVSWDPAYTQPAGFFVRGFECWATRSSSAATRSGNYYDLAGEDGCSADSTFVWDTAARTDNKDPFYFDAFAWYVSGQIAPEETVFINCRVRACDQAIDETQVNDFCYKPNENQNCVGNNLNSKRARRDASGGVGRAVEKVIMSTPIILKRRDVMDNSLNIERGDSVHMMDQGGVRMAAGMFSLFVTTMFFCLMVISYKVYRLRNNYKVMKDISAQEEQN